jgi:hypothetical protein
VRLVTSFQRKKLLGIAKMRKFLFHRRSQMIRSYRDEDFGKKVTREQISYSTPGLETFVDFLLIGYWLRKILGGGRRRGVGCGRGVELGVAVAVAVGLGLGVTLGLAVGVGVGVAVGVAVGVPVGVGDGVPQPSEVKCSLSVKKPTPSS